MFRIKKNKIVCFTLVEVTLVSVIMGLLIGTVYLNVSSARSKTVEARISSDLAALTLAKSFWRSDNPFSTFPVSESARFEALLPYLQASRPVTSLESMAVSGHTYYINDLTTAPSGF